MKKLLVEAKVARPPRKSTKKKKQEEEEKKKRARERRDIARALGCIAPVLKWKKNKRNHRKNKGVLPAT